MTCPAMLANMAGAGVILQAYEDRSEQGVRLSTKCERA